jgi:hypothetical protein
MSNKILFAAVLHMLYSNGMMEWEENSLTHIISAIVGWWFLCTRALQFILFENCSNEMQQSN